MSQPKWKLVANLGDVNPVDYGGYFVYVDETGIYPPEAELLEVHDDTDRWIAYRFSLDKCTYINGILSDNQYHPEYAAWLAKPESERKHRPQDTTYLSNVADCMGSTVDELVALFCSDRPEDRATAYRAVGDYHGFNNLDSYPLEFTDRAEIEARYAEEVAE